jgi:hypothetical protein
VPARHGSGAALAQCLLTGEPAFFAKVGAIAHASACGAVVLPLELVPAWGALALAPGGLHARRDGCLVPGRCRGGGCAASRRWRADRDQEMQRAGAAGVMATAGQRRRLLTVPNHWRSHMMPVANCGAEQAQSQCAGNSNLRRCGGGHLLASQEVEVLHCRLPAPPCSCPAPPPATLSWAAAGRSNSRS